MRFLVDAHLPRSLCAMLVPHGHDALHTLDLPAKNASKDRVINHRSWRWLEFGFGLRLRDFA